MLIIYNANAASAVVIPLCLRDNDKKKIYRFRVEAVFSPGVFDPQLVVSGMQNLWMWKADCI